MSSTKWFVITTSSANPGVESIHLIWKILVMQTDEKS